eukprot:TRINITY_DN22945_c0_g1_i1.p1 TRINITY_DN22945_c0_g1~~TRINITY_DN22945_c0_g1_i1.p1  ORF type:complete len:1131 (+),score=224.92 TRINITY_DN22945_c0_g1_i1:60-3395(+)
MSFASSSPVASKLRKARSQATFIQDARHNSNSKDSTGHFFDRERPTSCHALRKHATPATAATLYDAERPDSVGTPAESFCRVLRQRFGSVTAAWRYALDKDNKGKVSFTDFCNVARDIGYCKNLNNIWKELDEDGSGLISLNELDPKAATTLDEFFDFLHVKFSNTLKAWSYFDVDQNNRVELEEFETQLQKLGYLGNAKYLFKLLKVPAKNFLSLRDLDPQAHTAQMRGDVGMFLQKIRPRYNYDIDEILPMLRSGKLGGLEKPGSPKSPAIQVGNQIMGTGNQFWAQEIAKKQRELQFEHKKAHEQASLSASTLDSFKKLLVARYGTMIAAWRQGLDLDGNGRLSFGELCQALREMGFAGNALATWNALDRDGDGFIQLGDLDPKLEEMLYGYKDLVKEKFGNTLLAWLNGLKSTPNGTISKAAFTAHCKEIGFSGNVNLLFESLKNDKTRHFMTLRDYDLPAMNAYLRGDMEMISESPAIKGGKFEERNSNAFQQRWARMQSKQEIAERKEAAEEEISKDKAAGSVASMKELLLHKYGTVTCAWRHGFDGNENGRVSFVLFCNAMRRIGYSGNIKRCFNELDRKKKGHLTLEDLAPEAHEMITEFQQLLLDTHGDYITAWEALDVNRNNTLEEHELVEACKRIGYKKNAKQLFRYLLEHPSKRTISLGDLNPGAMRAFYRGDMGSMCGKERRAEIENAAQKERQMQLGAHDLSSLKKLLIRKYNTVTAAWRYGLDVTGQGRLSFVDFSKGCREVGFAGNVKRVFKQLDDDDSGLITFNELDPKWFKSLQNFSELLLAKYKTYESAWREIDADKSNFIDCNEFVEVCKELGYAGGPKAAAALFQQLLHPNQKYMTMADLQIGGTLIQAMTGFHMAREDDDLLSRDQVAKKAVQKLEQAKQHEKSMQMGPQDLNSLKKTLVRRFKTITAAWRYGLDVTTQGKISFVDFAKACRENSFTGDIRKCFSELDYDGSGIITFNEIDPKWFKNLQSFTELLLGKYESYENAWKAIDVHKNRFIDCKEFVEVCQQVGYEGGPQAAEALFEQLLQSGQKNLYMTDLQCGGTIVHAVTGFNVTRQDADEVPSGADHKAELDLQKTDIQLLEELIEEGS